MYGSVEMLLKFCAGNFSSEPTTSRIREKPAPAHTRRFGKKEISRLHSGYLPRCTSADRIHLALVNFSTKIFLIFFAAAPALVGMCDETEKNHSLC
jgi:hypothetical protein